MTSKSNVKIHVIFFQIASILMKSRIIHLFHLQTVQLTGSMEKTTAPGKKLKTVCCLLFTEKHQTIFTLAGISDVDGGCGLHRLTC